MDKHKPSGEKRHQRKENIISIIGQIVVARCYLKTPAVVYRPTELDVRIP